MNRTACALRVLLVLVGVLAATGPVAAVIQITPGDVGPANPATMTLDRNGRLFPRADSWVYSNVAMPFPPELNGATSIHVVLYFVPDANTTGNVRFQPLINAYDAGENPFYGGHVGNASPVAVSSSTTVYKQDFTITVSLFSGEIFALGIHRDILGSPADDYPSGVYLLAILVENSAASALSGPAGLPARPSLSVIPNPFLRNLTLQYAVIEPGEVDLQLFDVGGRLVQTIVHQTHPAGEYSIAWNGSGRPSGVYLLRLAVNGSVRTEKLIKLE
jgi:hypothetical protein